MNHLFEEFLKDCRELKKDVVRIECDGGSEFGQHITTLLNKNGIEQTVVPPSNKPSVGIVERFNKTIRTLIERYILTEKHPRWINILDDLQHNYNHSKHSTIGQTPASVTELDEENIAIKIAANRGKVFDGDIKIGDSVRIAERSKHKQSFEHGGQRWSRQIYTVERIEGQQIFVNNFTRSFKAYELQKVPKNTRQIDEVHTDVKKEVKLQRDTRRLKKEDIHESMAAARQELEKVVEKPQEIRRSTRERKAPDRLKF